MEGERKGPRRVGHPTDGGARPGPLDSEFNPLTILVDGEPGEWLAGRGHDQPYAVIRLVEIGGERGYRVVTWAKRSEDRELVGYPKTLRGAAALAQRDRMWRARPTGYWSGPPKAYQERRAALIQPDGVEGDPDSPEQDGEVAG